MFTTLNIMAGIVYIVIGLVVAFIVVKTYEFFKNYKLDDDEELTVRISIFKGFVECIRKKVHSTSDGNENKKSENSPVDPTKETEE